MIRAIFLDTTPLGLLTQRPGKSAEGDACRLWLVRISAQGTRFYVPEIADFEVRRELIRARKTSRE